MAQDRKWINDPELSSALRQPCSGGCHSLFNVNTLYISTTSSEIPETDMLPICQKVILKTGIMSPETLQIRSSAGIRGEGEGIHTLDSNSLSFSIRVR